MIFQSFFVWGQHPIPSALNALFPTLFIFRFSRMIKSSLTIAYGFHKFYFISLSHLFFILLLTNWQLTCILRIKLTNNENNIKSQWKGKYVLQTLIESPERLLKKGSGKKAENGLGVKQLNCRTSTLDCYGSTRYRATVYKIQLF